MTAVATISARGHRKGAARGHGECIGLLAQLRRVPLTTIRQRPISMSIARSRAETPAIATRSGISRCENVNPAMRSDAAAPMAAVEIRSLARALGCTTSGSPYCVVTGASWHHRSVNGKACSCSRWATPGRRRRRSHTGRRRRLRCQASHGPRCPSQRP